LYGYFCDIVVMMLLSENKYDDDDVSMPEMVKELSGVSLLLEQVILSASAVDWM